MVLAEPLTGHGRRRCRSTTTTKGSQAMTLRRMPKPALRPFVSSVWATDATPPTPLGARRELMLPAGAMHVAIRLGDSCMWTMPTP